MSYRISLTARNTSVNAHTTLLNKGANPNNSTINFYSNATSRPASPDTAVPSGSVLLLQIEFSSTAFSSATSATGVANNLPLSGNIVGNGTAAWFRFFTGASTPASIGDGDVTSTGGGGDITFNDVIWASGNIGVLNNLSISQPA